MQKLSKYLIILLILVFYITSCTSSKQRKNLEVYKKLVESGEIDSVLIKLRVNSLDSIVFENLLDKSNCFVLTFSLNPYCSQGNKTLNIIDSLAIYNNTDRFKPVVVLTEYSDLDLEYLDFKRKKNNTFFFLQNIDEFNYFQHIRKSYNIIDNSKIYLFYNRKIIAKFEDLNLYKVDSILKYYK